VVLQCCRGFLFARDSDRSRSAILLGGREKPFANVVRHIEQAFVLDALSYNRTFQMRYTGERDNQLPIATGSRGVWFKSQALWGPSSPFSRDAAARYDTAMLHHLRIAVTALSLTGSHLGDHR
jgi:hypothetical protein